MKIMAVLVRLVLKGYAETFLLRVGGHIHSIGEVDLRGTNSFIGYAEFTE